MRITFVSCVNYAPIQTLVDALNKRGERAAVLATYSNLQWRRLMSGQRTSVLRARLVSLLWLPLRMLAASLHPARHVLVVTTNPFHLPWIALLFRPLHRKRVVVLAYDIFPDALEATGVATAGRLVPWVAMRCNRITFKRADGIVFIGDRMKHNAVARYGHPRKSATICTGAEASARVAVPQTPEGSPIVFSYVGNLGHLHDWRTMSEGIRTFRGHPDVTFRLAASGPGGRMLNKSLETEADTASVEFLPPLDDEEWRALLEATAVCLVSLRAEAGTVSVPSKVFSAMGAGAAVLAVAPLHSDLAEVVQQSDCGLVVEPGDAKGFVAAVELLLADRESLRKMRENSLAAIRVRYGMDACAQAWDRFLQDVTSVKGDAR